jgi:hypothetical protein
MPQVAQGQSDAIHGKICGMMTTLESWSCEEVCNLIQFIWAKYSPIKIHH